jgi:ferrous iron transport protein A
MRTALPTRNVQELAAQLWLRHEIPNASRLRCSRTAGGGWGAALPLSGFPLVQAGDGERVAIIAIDGGAGAQRKLAHLGLAPGKTIEIVTRQPGGPLLVAVGETRVAVGFGLALKVRVAAASGGEGTQ